MKKICKNCKFWFKRIAWSETEYDPGGIIGVCERINYEGEEKIVVKAMETIATYNMAALSSLHPETKSELITKSEFGCTLFEAQEGLVLENMEEAEIIPEVVEVNVSEDYIINKTEGLS